ncbi:hypothetical protein RM151_11455 [Pantoea agglomerans]|uniref:hypothetical protein n=1 Tax=Enterobacter agglomerans TaxID=549 RepID=UPI00289C9F2B|nr:hypothetical protein [Pantoea agglomerans]WNK56713.1 hypothetical protein RM151_11455 [Pantoea agglomerans]
MAEWIITGILIPVIFGVWQIVKSYYDGNKEKEERLDDLETRVTVLESKVDNIQGDIEEIKELRKDIRKIQQDIVKVLTLLDERTKRGQ